MTPLELLDAAKGGPFSVRLGGELHEFPDPADLTFQEVLAVLYRQHLPNTPPCSERQRTRLFESWAAHYDLPPFADAQRLTYLVDHYTEALASDFRRFLQLDLGECWRGRRWRTMLGYIDRLPGHSWYSAAVSGDAEHAEMLAKAILEREAAREDEDVEEIPEGPSWVNWTPEVAALTTLTNAVRHLTHVTISVNTEKPPPAPEPLPTPHSPLEKALKRARYARRKAKHEALVARLLPNKARSGS